MSMLAVRGTQAVFIPLLIQPVEASPKCAHIFIHVVWQCVLYTLWGWHMWLAGFIHVFVIVVQTPFGTPPSRVCACVWDMSVFGPKWCIKELKFEHPIHYKNRPPFQPA